MCGGHAHEKDFLSDWADALFNPICPSLHCQFVCSGHIIFADFVWKSISEEHRVKQEMRCIKPENLILNELFNQKMKLSRAMQDQIKDDKFIKYEAYVALIKGLYIHHT